MKKTLIPVFSALLMGVTAASASQEVITDDKVSTMSRYLDALPSLKSPIEVQDEYRKPFEYAREVVRRREIQPKRFSLGDNFSQSILTSLTDYKVSGVVPTEGLRPGMLILNGNILGIGDYFEIDEEGEIEVRLLQVREDEYLVNTRGPDGKAITISVPITMFDLTEKES